MRVLLVSTSLGAGHDGVALEVAQRLESRGHRTKSVNYLDLLPPGVGSGIKKYYEAQLRFVPWSYQRSYQAFPRVKRQFAAVNGFLAAHRMLEVIFASNCDVIIPNNPHAIMALGYMKLKKKVRVPVISHILDFGVHPLWTHPSLDGALVIHHIAARQVREQGMDSVRVCGPIVPRRFKEATYDPGLRQSLGIPGDHAAILVTAGSWGVGQLGHTVNDLRNVEKVTPIVLCGQDKALQRKIARLDGCVSLGWVDDMPTLLASVDAMIENAGGLASAEAIATGLPLFTYRPIAGHGRHNAEVMAEAGLTSYLRNESELRQTMARFATTRTRTHSSNLPVPSGDVVSGIEEILAG